MVKSDKLIPAKFLTLVAHFAICLTLLWSSRESTKACLWENHTEETFQKQQTQMIWGLSLALVLITFELLTFLTGLTMFNATSCLISVGCHGSASIFMSQIVLAGWQCGWYWVIFAFCSVTPVHGWTKLLVIAGAATTIGLSLTVGFNIGVVNSPAEIVKQFCNESVIYRYNHVLSKTGLEVLWSSIVSIFLVGGAVGSLSGSWLANRVGRKGGIIVSTILSIIAAILFIASKSSNSVEMLLLGRLIVGFASGLATCIVPMYLMELAPLELRGAMGVLCPLGLTFGVLAGQVMSLSKVLGTENSWPYLFGLYLLFLIIASTAFPFLPESPKYLYLVKNDKNSTIRELMRIRGVPEECLNVELLELQAEKSQEDNSNGAHWNLKSIITDRGLFLPLLLVCSMQAGQQLSGINAVFYYSFSIFKNAGLSDENSQYATIGAGVINLGMAVISIHIMSKYNRRTIFLLSTGTSALFLILLGIAISYIGVISWMPYLSIVGVLGFVLCYGIGLGPIPYFIGSELFETGPRPSAMALGSMANWGGNFLVGMTFPLMQQCLGPLSFFVFAFFVVLLFLFIRFYLPETRGHDPYATAQLCKEGRRRRPIIKPMNSKIVKEYK